MATEDLFNCVTCRQCPVGQYASEQWKKKIAEKKSQNSYKKGQYIFYQGNPVFGMFMIAQGKVKIVTHVSAKKEQIVRLTSDGHILGRQGRNHDVYANSAVAMEHSQICFIDNQLLEELLANNTELGLNLLQYYSGELRMAEKRIKILAQLHAQEKIAETLLYTSSVFGVDNDGFINAILSRQEIADISGISVENVSRKFSLLKDQKIIDLIGKKIKIIDQERLKEVGQQLT